MGCGESQEIQWGNVKEGTPPVLIHSPENQKEREREEKKVTQRIPCHLAWESNLQ